MDNSFKEMGITDKILSALSEMGFEEPTEVQCKAIPHVLNNRDTIVMSKTGSGKTAVFGVSMLQMIDPQEPGPQGLILTPARELAVQVDSDIRQIGKYMPHRTAVVYGQHNMNTEVQALKNGISIVTGTPGRVYDHIIHGSLITKNIRFLVLDEADRMLDMGFIDQVTRIIGTLPKNRLTMLFSATIPEEVKRICRHHMKNPVTVEIESNTKTVDTIDQIYYRVNENEKRTRLNQVLLTERPENCMIFCNTRIAVDRVQSYLSKKGYNCKSLHGDIPQAKRLKTMEQFKNGTFHLLAATDVAARGIHIEGLSLVINYDVPNEKDSYIHRIGRTGRAGKNGRAITLVTGDDLMSLYEIEEHIGALIEESELPSDEYFNEHKDEIDIWIGENTPKNQPVSTNRQRKGSHKHSHTQRKASASGTESAQPDEAASGQNTGLGGRTNTSRNTGRNSRAASGRNTGHSNGAASGKDAGYRNGAVSNRNSRQNNKTSSTKNTGQNSRTVSYQNEGQSGKNFSCKNTKQNSRVSLNRNADQSSRNTSYRNAGQNNRAASGSNTGLNRGAASNTGQFSRNNTGPNAGKKVSPASLQNKGGLKTSTGNVKGINGSDRIESSADKSSKTGQSFIRRLLKKVFGGK